MLVMLKHLMNKLNIPESFNLSSLCAIVFQNNIADLRWYGFFLHLYLTWGAVQCVIWSPIALVAPVIWGSVSFYLRCPKSHFGCYTTLDDASCSSNPTVGKTLSFCYLRLLRVPWISTKPTQKENSRNCVPRLADIFLYTYEEKFVKYLRSYESHCMHFRKKKHDGKEHIRFAPVNRETWSNFHLLYDKRDDFNFHITIFPFLRKNIQSSPAFAVLITQLIRYARVCLSYRCFILRAMQLSKKLLGHRFVTKRLESSLRKFYGRSGNAIKHYEAPSHYAPI